MLRHDVCMCVYVVCAARTWTPEGETQRYRYTPTATNVNQHTEHVDVDGELFYNFSMMAAEVGTAAACEGRSISLCTLQVFVFVTGV